MAGTGIYGKLGAEYTDVRASITDMTMLTDQSYAPLKKQMQEYMVYAAAEKGVQMGVDQMKEKQADRMEHCQRK